ncbi:hypothetical protein [Sorangium sp. So ce124]|uniref:hypothetical protein n=1 Tax=Sorangium sp. So ce124 TaxID=3133280 RepID=UPI003F603349
MTLNPSHGARGANDAQPDDALASAEVLRPQPVPGASNQLHEVMQAFDGGLSLEDFQRGVRVQVNSFATFTRVRARNGINGLVVTVPVKGKGLKIFPVSERVHPELYAMLDSGLLVRPEEMPQKVLFHCFLDDPPQELLPRVSAPSAGRGGEAHELIVNPSFLYQQGDEIPDPIRVRTAYWPATDVLHGYPLAWIEDPGTRVLFPYWVRARYAEILPSFVPGEPAPRDLDPDLLERLQQAHILVPGDFVERRQAAWRRVREDARRQLDEVGYAVMRGVLHPFVMAAMRRYYRRLLAEGHIPFGDTVQRYWQHNERIARYFHHQLADLMGDSIGGARKPSYCYFASYVPGAVLERHVDRVQCEISTTFLVDYQPDPASTSPWPIGLEVQKPEKRDIVVHQAPGDALLYKGAELPHFRDALPDGHASTSIFFHYVPADFGGSLL